MAVIQWLISLVAFILSALPLYFAVKFLGGKTSLLKTMLVVILGGIVVTAIRSYFKILGGLIAFIVLIWIYREMFRLKWIKAFLAWLLQFVFLAIFYIIAFLLALLFGLGALALLF